MEDCLDTLLSFHKGRPNCFEKGLVIIVYKDYLNQNIDKFTSEFYPFALVQEVSLNRHFARSGSKLREDKNKIKRGAISVAKSSIKIRNQITSYLQSRCNRTPFLLPIRHFGEIEVAKLIEDAWSSTTGEDNIHEKFDELARGFEQKFPFKKVKKGAAGWFENKKSIEFRPPGRHLHGVVRPNVDGHKLECFFNGTLRIGGQINPGFHYDCTNSGGSHAGQFRNCHDELVNKAGKPHLNVYPNDFIR